jgi:hypothetical protein
VFRWCVCPPWGWAGTPKRVCLASGCCQGVFGCHKSDSLRVGQADWLRTLAGSHEQVYKWLEDPCCRWQEPLVEVDCAKESLQLADGCRLRMGEHLLHRSSHGLDTGGRHLAQELDDGLIKNALLWRPASCRWVKIHKISGGMTSLSSCRIRFCSRRIRFHRRGIKHQTGAMNCSQSIGLIRELMVPNASPDQCLADANTTLSRHLARNYDMMRWLVLYIPILLLIFY